MPWMRQLSLSMPVMSWQVFTAIFGIGTTSALSRLSSEKTASKPFVTSARTEGVEALKAPATLLVSTSRSAPSASP